tara:strand:+ start:13758 stop:14075 length:318 start_codon:yes stop_codon:yes gene_type:complete
MNYEERMKQRVLELIDTLDRENNGEKIGCITFSRELNRRLGLKMASSMDIKGSYWNPDIHFLGYDPAIDSFVDRERGPDGKYHAVIFPNGSRELEERYIELNIID